ncbi:MAG: hypothetical protein ACFFD4_08325 [Candidatus Odinarchaeota archaeon]
MPGRDNNQYSPCYKKIKDEILKQMETNPYEAFSIIRGFLDYPGKAEDDSIWKDVLALFERVVTTIFNEQLGELVRKVIDDPDDVQALYDLSYELYEIRLYGIAATLLSRADKILPRDEKIVTELVSNFEALMMNHEACNVLSDAGELLASSDLCRYLLGFNRVMTGNVDEARKILPTIQNSTDGDIRFMAERLEWMISRALVLKEVRSLDDKDLRGWHVVLNGSFLLHLSPFGLDVMNGRYAYISDSYSLCRQGIERLKEVLSSAEVEIPCIYYLPNRSSRILAMAASKIFKKPIREWNESNHKLTGLIIVYDLNEINAGEILERLAVHRPGQVLWAHASCWTNPFPFAPDVTTFLYQQNVSPWGAGRIFYNRKSTNVEFTEANESPEEEIISWIVNAEADAEYLNDLDDLLSMISPLKEMRSNGKPGIFRSKGKRLRQRLGSPVSSNRF